MDKSEKKMLLISSSLIILPYFLRTVYMTFMPVFAKESTKFLLGPVEIGMAVSAMGVAGFFAPFAFSELATKKGVKNVIVLGMVVEVCVLVVANRRWFSSVVTDGGSLGAGRSRDKPVYDGILDKQIPVFKPRSGYRRLWRR
jgi:MFS family permease